MFEDIGFHVDELLTWPFQTPDFTIHWIMNKFLNYLPQHIRNELLSMPLSEFMVHEPGSAWWKHLYNFLPPDAISELACGNTLIATKK